MKDFKRQPSDQELLKNHEFLWFFRGQIVPGHSDQIFRKLKANCGFMKLLTKKNVDFGTNFSKTFPPNIENFLNRLFKDFLTKSRQTHISRTSLPRIMDVSKIITSRNSKPESAQIFKWRSDQKLCIIQFF